MNKASFVALFAMDAYIAVSLRNCKSQQIKIVKDSSQQLNSISSLACEVTAHSPQKCFF